MLEGGGTGSGTVSIWVCILALVGLFINDFAFGQDNLPIPMCLSQLGPEF